MMREMSMFIPAYVYFYTRNQKYSGKLLTRKYIISWEF